MTDAAPDAAPVTGELIDPPAATVQPDQASQNAGADRARGRTAIQVGTPGFLVIIGTWYARLKGIDLNPLPGEEEMPADVVSAFIGLVTVLLAVRMNPKR